MTVPKISPQKEVMATISAEVTHLESKLDDPVAFRDFLEELKEWVQDEIDMAEESDAR